MEEEKQRSFLLQSASRFPLPLGARFSYGIAGFRSEEGSILTSTVFRAGILAALRALKTRLVVGLMISDNGVKIVDPDGGMMTQLWKSFAEALANAPDGHQLLELIVEFVKTENIPFGGGKYAEILLERDTSASSEALVEAAKQGINSIIGAVAIDMEILTTPQLHLMVSNRNKGLHASGFNDDFTQLSNSFGPEMDLGPKEMVKDGMEYHAADSEHLMKRMCTGQSDSEHLMKRMCTGQSDEGSFSGATHPPNINPQDHLPKTVVRTLNQRSNVMSFDFHPQQQTILLVGTNIGDIGVWEIGSREKISHKTFKVWDIQACTEPLKTALMKDATISVNRCLWSPDGSILLVAFSKHLVQTYTFSSIRKLRGLRQELEVSSRFSSWKSSQILVSDLSYWQQLEIDAHIGGVNDIAFSHPNESLSIVTCGDDKTIKVWDATTGERQYIFEGHEAPVYSVCPHHKENIPFVFSTAIDGKIKAWLYDCQGARVDYDAPGLWSTMAYSADKTKLFICGTSKEGDSNLVEWNEADGNIKRTYSGFTKRSLGVVQFDTTRNRFLAVGDDFKIKFWDMDNTDILTIADADGGLHATPRLRFNKEGSLLAVTSNDNGIKILANIDGQRLIRMMESRAFESSRGNPRGTAERGSEAAV